MTGAVISQRTAAVPAKAPGAARLSHSQVGHLPMEDLARLVRYSQSSVFEVSCFVFLVCLFCLLIIDNFCSLFIVILYCGLFCIFKGAGCEEGGMRNRSSGPPNPSAIRDFQGSRLHF